MVIKPARARSASKCLNDDGTPYRLGYIIYRPFKSFYQAKEYMTFNERYSCSLYREYHSRYSHFLLLESKIARHRAKASKDFPSPVQTLKAAKASESE